MIGHWVSRVARQVGNGPGVRRSLCVQTKGFVNHPKAGVVSVTRPVNPNQKKKEASEGDLVALNGALNKNSAHDAMLAFRSLITVGFSLSVPCHEKLLATVAQTGRVADLVAIMSECPGDMPTTTAIVTIAEPLLLSGNTTVFADFLRAYVVDGASESMDVSAVLDAIVYARAKRYSAQTAVTAPEAAGMNDIIDLLETAPVRSSSSSSSGSSSSSSSSSSSGRRSSTSIYPGELGDMLWRARLFQLVEAEMGAPGVTADFLDVFTLWPPLVPPAVELQCNLLVEDRDNVDAGTPLEIFDLTASVTRAAGAGGHTLLRADVFRKGWQGDDLDTLLSDATQHAFESSVNEMMELMARDSSADEHDGYGLGLALDADEGEDSLEPPVSSIEVDFHISHVGDDVDHLDLIGLSDLRDSGTMDLEGYEEMTGYEILAGMGGGTAKGPPGRKVATAGLPAHLNDLSAQLGNVLAEDEFW